MEWFKMFIQQAWVQTVVIQPVMLWVVLFVASVIGVPAYFGVAKDRRTAQEPALTAHLIAWGSAITLTASMLALGIIIIVNHRLL
ncbi:hypothetical protein HY933_03155 [Candidatus Falkowbacteria bacterium]|nr:hypothetical protein [Candidatus Falkowbacteria bacterium]